MDPVVSNEREYTTGLMRAGPRMFMQPGYESAYPVIGPKDRPKKGGGLRGFFPWVWDQNPNNSCGGHGAAAAMNAAWNFQGEAKVEFSPDFVYALCNGGRDQGSVPEDLMQALAATGACLRATGPHGKIYASQYNRSAFAEAARFRADLILGLDTFDELATAVLRRQAVFTGIFCGGRFNPDSDGLLPDWDGREVGGHCTAQIGEYEEIPGRGPGLWTLNSWGDGWGWNGWCWVPKSYFDGGLRAFRGCAVVTCRRDPQDVEPAAKPAA